jgi:hypothetical protein
MKQPMSTDELLARINFMSDIVFPALNNRTPFSEIDGTHPENDCTLEIFTWHKYNFEMAHLLDLLGTFSK